MTCFMNVDDERLAIAGVVNGRQVMYVDGLLMDVTPENMDRYAYYADRPSSRPELEKIHAREVAGNPVYNDLKVRTLQLNVTISME